MRAVDLVQQEPLSATDAVAFVAALLASQFMLLVTCQKKWRNRDSRDLQSHDVA